MKFEIGTSTPGDIVAKYWDKKVRKWKNHEAFSYPQVVPAVRKALGPLFSAVEPEDLVLNVSAGANQRNYYPKWFDEKKPRDIKVKGPRYENYGIYQMFLEVIDI